MKKYEKFRLFGMDWIFLLFCFSATPGSRRRTITRLKLKLRSVFLTFADDTRRFETHTQVTPVDELLALPQTLLGCIAHVVIQRPVVVSERRIKPGEVLRLGAALQHGAHHGGHAYVPAVIAHRAPAAVTVDLQFTGAAVQTSTQSDVSHLCAQNTRREDGPRANAFKHH